jgi:hypothetical protein
MTQKFVPFEKLSKKKKRERNADARHGWGALSPITRVPPNPKAYDRNKEKAIRRNGADSLLFGGCCSCCCAREI